MTPPRATPSTDQEEDQASLWAARLRSSQLSRSQRDELRTWLDASPAHRTLLDGYCECSADLDAALAVLKSEQRVRAPTLARSSRWAWIGGFSIAAAMAAAVVVFVLRTPEQILRSLPGQRSAFTLADGTVVNLNGHSSAIVSLERHERRVTLTEGEALFTVAKDPSRPFYVTTPHGVVRVTGTVFNVRADAPEREEVTVLEGHVQVSSKKNVDPVSIHAGDQVFLAGEKPSVHPLSAEDLRRVTAWRDGRIVFKDEPLRSALECFAWYHGRKIDASAHLDGLTLGGQYDLDDLDTFLSGIEQILPVKVLRGSEGSITVVPR